jgi:pyruvate/2-oxoglutarate dehydrogenase complex dihydrolipoamide acyltransferase (E2) component
VLHCHAYTGDTSQSEAEAAAAELTRAARQRALPPAVADWSLTDVSYWLHSLSLGEYSAAFKAACVDGAFLLTLTQDDCAGALGMRHTLHIKKLFTALAAATAAAPATTAGSAAATGSATAGAVVAAAAARRLTADMSSSSTASGGSNDNTSSSSDAVEAALSQARHGRVARLEASLRQGAVSVNARCARTGNTLLIEAAQNCCTDCCQLLVQRGADVNARNKRGNTALHYAMAHDTSGLLGEFLIENGANDTLLNRDGLSAYDGIVGGTV